MLSKIINNKQELNISAIIELVKDTHPDRADVIIGLQKFVGGHLSSKAYYQFVDSKNANQVGAEWQHDDCIVIAKMDMVIDLLKDGRIGGIEFISLLDY
ncbi:MAG: hypothetical protein IPP29_10265 [Bacteroidetes bacterium]|nr:hypothetical protein [Bacteroidota bacterium]